jgi:hypothetical protein
MPERRRSRHFCLGGVFGSAIRSMESSPFLSQAIFYKQLFQQLLRHLSREASFVSFRFACLPEGNCDTWSNIISTNYIHVSSYYIYCYIIVISFARMEGNASRKNSGQITYKGIAFEFLLYILKRKCQLARGFYPPKACFPRNAAENTGKWPGNESSYA